MKIIFLILLHYATASSNVLSIGVDGGSIGPRSKTKTSMFKERVLIKLYRDSCDVTCRFWLKNEKRDESLMVGFPINILSTELYSHSIRNFTCRVNGKEVATSPQQATSKRKKFYKYDTWLIWNMNIKRDSTYTIECTYTDNMHSKYYYYIGSGTSWHGPIRDGKIIYDFSEIAPKELVVKPETYVKKKKDKKAYHATYVMPTVNDTAQVYSFSDYRPGRNEFVSFEFFSCNNLASLYHQTENGLVDYAPVRRWIYPPRDRFLHEYLADTVRFSHRNDYQNLKAALGDFSRNSSDSLIALSLEYAVDSILTDGIDSVMEGIRNRQRMTTSITYRINDVTVYGGTGEPYQRRLLEDIIKRLEERCVILKNIIGKNLNGTLSVKQKRTLNDLTATSKTLSRPVIDLLLEQLGFVPEVDAFDNTRINFDITFITK